MLEVARNSVQNWEIDQMGHMNVQFYVARALDGLAALGVHLGLGPRALNQQGLALELQSLHIRFLHECRVSTPFYLRAGTAAVDAHGLTVYEELVRTSDDEIAAAYTLRVQLVDLRTREQRMLPEASRTRALELLMEIPPHGQPRGLTAPVATEGMSLDGAVARGLFPTCQERVRAEQCDSAGWLRFGTLMRIASNAVPNLLTPRGGLVSTAGNGGAALEYRLIFRTPCRRDDILTLRSGVMAIGTKTYSFCHWIFNLETGAAVASVEALGIPLDLKTRKAMPIPEGLRAHLQRHLIDSLHA